MVDGTWIDNPKNVKKEFLDHFSKRFCKPGEPMTTLQMEFPNQIQLDQRNELESDVSNDEIKKAVWECETDKAPGPDGFTFGFFSHFWHLVEKEVQDDVRAKLGDGSKNKDSWVQWSKVLAPKVNGGLGVSSLFALNRVNTIWDDDWCEGGRLKDRFPRAYALDACKEITVGSKLVQHTITYSFRRPPRGGVKQMQTDKLTTLMQNVSLNPMQDRWTWTLNASGDFSVASVKNLIDTTIAFRRRISDRWIRVVPIR
ncbi:hypothetical protein Tco_1106196 [Tanacetum coccineum]